MILYSSSLPADKGSGIMIMNREIYAKNVNEELSKNDTYKEIKVSAASVTKKIKKLVKDMHNRGWLDEKGKKYMTQKFPRRGIVKGNRKMYKKPIPIRSVVSRIEHTTEKLAEVAEQERDEWTSYITDTTHFLRQMSSINNMPHNTVLFTMAVRALYPSVPTKQGPDACEKALNNRTDKTIPTEAVMQIIGIVLDNVFKFGDTH